MQHKTEMRGVVTVITNNGPRPLDLDAIVAAERERCAKRETVMDLVEIQLELQRDCRERIAAAVAAERERCADEVKWHEIELAAERERLQAKIERLRTGWQNQVDRMYDTTRTAERERCAQICRALANDGRDSDAKVRLEEAEAAIRKGDGPEDDRPSEAERERCDKHGERIADRWAVHGNAEAVEAANSIVEAIRKGE